jgi:hypothetical protein
MLTYTFFFITSGDSTKAFADPSAEKMVLLKPLVQARGGEIPFRPGYQCDIWTLDGGAMFSVRQGQLLLSFGGVAGTAQADEKVWPHLQDAHLTSYKAVIENHGFNTPDNFLTIPEKPAELPWVAVSHQPGMGQDMGAAPWVGNFFIELGQELLLEAMGQGRF